MKKRICFPSIITLFILFSPIMFPLLTQPFSVIWRKALLSAPRLVPDAVLYFTSPEGPHPIIINIPSRGSHLIPLYVFIPPTGEKPPLPKFPVLIDFHGGGFIFGSCQEQAPFCSKMSRELNAVSISVDYRMGPTSKFPAANEDAEDVINAILDSSKPGYEELREGVNQFMRRSTRPEIELDESRIAVSGFSSGGNLALNLGLSIRASREVEKDWPTVFPAPFGRDIPLILFYPSLDCRKLPSERPLPPGMEMQKGFLQSLQLEAELMPTYLPRYQAGHPRASPGLADTRNGGLHENVKMFLVLPQFDTLAAQSDIWIEKLANEGRSDDLIIKKVKGVAQ